MSLVEKFINDNTHSFIKKTTQLYTIFSVAFYTMRENIEITEETVSMFGDFVRVYEKYKNEDNATLSLNMEEQSLYDQIKKYKQASSEGIRKQVNRMTRFNVLKNFLFSSVFSQEIINSLIAKLSN